MLADLFHDGRWKSLADGRYSIECTPAPRRKGTLEDAGVLLSLYQDATRKAEGGQLAVAAARYDEGLAVFDRLKITVKTPQHQVVRWALLCGKGAALDQMGNFEEAWDVLMRVFGPTVEVESFPLSMTLTWIHSASVCGSHCDKWLEVFAMLDFLALLKTLEPFCQDSELQELVDHRLASLDSVRLLTFEGLLKQGRDDLAAHLADQCLELVALDDEQLTTWERLARLARQPSQDFNLKDFVAQPSEKGKQLFLLVAWHRPGARFDDNVAISQGSPGPRLNLADLDAPARLSLADPAPSPPLPPGLSWELVEKGPDPRSSSLFDICERAAKKAEQADLEGSLGIYRAGLKAFQRIEEPTLADELVRSMLLWGRALVQDRMAQSEGNVDGLAEAWEGLISFVDPQTRSLPKPLSVVLQWSRWVGGIALRQACWSEVEEILGFLIRLGGHARVLESECGHDLEEILGSLLREALKLQDLEWLRDLQRGHEAKESVVPVLREVLFEALSAQGLFGEALDLARRVLEWGGETNKIRVLERWRVYARQAGEALRDPYQQGRGGDLALLARLQPVDQVGPTGSTALLGAVSAGKADAVSLLLQMGASVNLADSQGRTPLFQALGLGTGAAPMIRLLGGRGADFNAQDDGGRTALHLAAQGGLLEVVEVLLELGADPRILDGLGQSPLHLAAGGSRSEAVIPLLANLIGVDCRASTRANTPLMAAAEAGQIPNLQTLLRLGADPALRDNERRTALDYARSQGHAEAATLLSELTRPRGILAKVRGLFGA